MKLKKKILKKMIKPLLILILLIVIIYTFKRYEIIREIFLILFISFIISYTLKPIHHKLVEHGFNRRISAALLICILFIIAFAVLAFLIPSVLKESMNVNNMINRIQLLVNRLYEKVRLLRNNKAFYTILDDINNKVSISLKIAMSKIFNSLFNIMEHFISLFVIPIISYYFLTDSLIIGNMMLNIFPVNLRNIVKKTAKDIDAMLGRYIVSQVLLCVIIGVITFFILIYLHIDFPVLLSLINALFNIIPYFGPVFGAIPALVMAFIKSPRTALYAAIFLYVLQLVEGNILSPKITGDSVSMHPLTVILLLVIGDKVAGFAGMVLAVPIGVVLKIIYEDLNYYLF
jgi:predicted PurR-regulated permease PerM